MYGGCLLCPLYPLLVTNHWETLQCILKNSNPLKMHFTLQQPSHALLKHQFLVELALAEWDSKNTGVSVFFFFFWSGTYFVGHTFLAKTVETKDKNRDDFHCMQRSLVISMRFIFGDDWNDACKFGNDVISPNRGPWFSSNYARHARVLKSKYPVGWENVIAGKSCFMVYWGVTFLRILSQLLEPCG